MSDSAVRSGRRVPSISRGARRGCRRARNQSDIYTALELRRQRCLHTSGSTLVGSKEKIKLSFIRTSPFLDVLPCARMGVALWRLQLPRHYLEVQLVRSHTSRRLIASRA